MTARNWQIGAESILEGALVGASICTGNPIYIVFAVLFLILDICRMRCYWRDVHKEACQMIKRVLEERDRRG